MNKVVFIAFLLFPLCGLAAVIQEAHDAETDTTADAAHSFSFTAGSSAEAVVVIAHNDDSGGAAVSAVTYDGNSLTAAAATCNTTAKSRVYYWAPGAGSLPDSGSVAVTWTASTDYKAFGVWAFSGVDTADLLGTVGCDTSTTSPSTNTITDGAAGDLIVSGVYAWSQSFSAGTGVTIDSALSYGTDFYNYGHASGGASVDVSWTWSGSQSQLSHSAVNVNASTDTGIVTPTVLFQITAP